MSFSHCWSSSRTRHRCQTWLSRNLRFQGNWINVASVFLEYSWKGSSMKFSSAVDWLTISIQWLATASEMSLQILNPGDLLVLLSLQSQDDNIQILKWFQTLSTKKLLASYKFFGHDLKDFLKLRMLEYLDEKPTRWLCPMERWSGHPVYQTKNHALLRGN